MLPGRMELRKHGGTPLRIALTRSVSPKIGQCELTYLPRVAIDAALARTQHRAYQNALEQLGCKVLSLPEEPDLPDAVFVEDAAVILDEIAIMTRPGAESRRPETASVSEVLTKYRELRSIEPPGTLDGGDVLRVGKTLYVGSSSRTSRPGIEQLASAASPFGYQVLPVPVVDCLHFKSAVTLVGPRTLLINRRWVDSGYFTEVEFIGVDDQEPSGANALIVGNQLIYPTSFPRTRQRLEARGIRVTSVDVSEIEKAEGAVTCCSLIFESLERSCAG
jgi:dimethylargininase